MFERQAPLPLEASGTSAATSCAVRTSAPQSFHESTTAGFDAEPAIVIVDDEEITLRCAGRYLKNAGCHRMTLLRDPKEFLDLLKREPVDLALLDVVLPGMSGIELLKQLRRQPAMAHLPVIMLTAHSDVSVRYVALEAGANDFLAKPLDALEIVPRVRNLLALRRHQRWLEETSERLEAEVRRRTSALVRAQHHVIHCLARAAEFRDNDTGRHIIRVGLYCALIARALGLGDTYAEMIEQAAKLHDVGKIGIPDHILLKPGKLDETEFASMQAHSRLGRHVLEGSGEETPNALVNHPEVGSRILEMEDSPLLEMASRIAMSHHERWDGTGYPQGLQGTEIPLEGRITAVADVFDALSMKRPYKPAYAAMHCFDLLRQGRGTQFEPAIVDAFLSRSDDAIRILHAFGDD